MRNILMQHTNQESRITFDYDNAKKFWYHPEDGTGADYAFIYLRPYYRELLEKNKIEPLNEEVWKTAQPHEFDTYWMLGVPNDFIIQKDGIIEKGYALINIERLDEPPVCSEIRFAPNMFYGCINISPEFGRTHQPLNNIEGMSGGPIFGFKKMQNGECRYWIVASQSSWYKQERIIVGCPVWVLAEWISQIELPLES